MSSLHIVSSSFQGIFRQFQQVVRSADHRDTINIDPVTYIEQVIIDKDLITGSGADGSQNAKIEENISYAASKIAVIDIERQNRLSSLNHDNNSIFYR